MLLESNVIVVPHHVACVPVEVIRARYSLREARASRRELHHKSVAAAAATRKSLAEARALKTSAAAYEAFEANLAAQRRLGDCHRVWAALAAFLAGRPYATVEAPPRSGRPRRAPLSTFALAITLQEVALDPAVRQDRKAPPTKVTTEMAYANVGAEEALRAWLRAETA